MNDQEPIQLPSRYAIGQKVLFCLHGGPNDGIEIVCYVRAIRFTNIKVRYDLLIPSGDPPETTLVTRGIGTTIRDVDSANVQDAQGEPEFIEWDPDWR